MAERLRRDIHDWTSAPRDGTPFHILNMVRFNPLANQWECLIRTEDSARRWTPANVEEDACAPSKWLKLVPLPYEIPTSFAFTLTYAVRPKTMRERFGDWLFRYCHAVTFKALIGHEMTSIARKAKRA